MSEGPSAGEVFEDPAVLDGEIEAANSASAETRTIYLTFLLVGTYVAITIGSTSDEQLLRSSDVNLPILNVGVPIIAFYTIVPWLIVVLHLNLLLQLYFLSKRLHPLARRFRAGMRHWIDRLHSFPFNHYVVGSQKGVVGLIVSTIVVVSFLLFPLSLLVSAQVRFLPYHDAGLTNVQRIAVLADLLLLWIFWPMIRGKSEGWKAWFMSVLKRSTELTPRWFDLWRRTSLVLNLVTVSLFVFFFSVSIVTVPGGSEQGYFHSLRSELFDQPDSLLHRNLRLSDATLLHSLPSAEILSAIEMGGLERSEALRKIRGLNLSGRDLRGADFSNSLLVKADLRGADLSGAVLRGADLEGADMRPALSPGGDCLQADQRRDLSQQAERSDSGLILAPMREGAPATVCVTSFEKANLSDATLMRARLQLANLSESILRGAKLQSAVLSGADLSGALLDQAKLHEADLENSNLAGAKLQGAELIGADLEGAKLRGWNADRVDFTSANLPPRAPLRGLTLKKLSGAHMPEADFRDADLSRADLRGSEFRGADFRNATLTGADADGADFRDADFRDVEMSQIKLQGANLASAQLMRANLKRARLVGTQLDHASLRSADLSFATLDGASVTEVDLRAANLTQAQLHFATFYTCDMTAAKLTRAKVWGSRFPASELGLSDLQGLGTIPVGSQRADQLRQIASSGDYVVADHSEDPFQYSDSGPDVLCDRNPLLAPFEDSCLDSKQIDRYVAGLVNLVCQQPRPEEATRWAQDIAQRALLKPESLSYRTPDYKPVTSYETPLAAALMDSECPAVLALPEETRRKLAARGE